MKKCVSRASNKEQVRGALIDHPDEQTRKTVTFYSLAKKRKILTVKLPPNILNSPLFPQHHQIPTLLTSYNEKLSVSTKHISSENIVHAHEIKKTNLSLIIVF